MKHVFGPVPSRRLGSSLGVDLVPHKVCSFDCIYCQLGGTTDKTLERRHYAPVEDIVGEVGDFLDRGGCDYVTMSGSGEPTLNADMGAVIDGVKSLTDTPVAVLTNSSLINDSGVRAELAAADVVVPSLDAATQEVFERVNRPVDGLLVEDIIDGLASFNGAEVWLEVMLVNGVNDTPDELEALSSAVDGIEPDKVQLNTVVRPPAEDYAGAIRRDRMDEIAGFLGAEVVADFSRAAAESYSGDVEEGILELLMRRPCTVDDLSSALGVHENEILKYVGELRDDGRAVEERRGGRRYFKGVVE